MATERLSEQELDMWERDADVKIKTHHKGCAAIDDHHVCDGITFKPCNCCLSEIAALRQQVADQRAARLASNDLRVAVEIDREATRAENRTLRQQVEALTRERDETLMLTEHPQISNLRDLAMELACRGQRILDLEAERDALRQALREVIDAYDGYRGRGLMTAADEYARMVRGIEAARAALTPKGSADGR